MHEDGSLALDGAFAPRPLPVGLHPRPSRRATPMPGAADPDDAGWPFPFVGRASEMATLRNALRRAKLGSGSVVLVRGGPGSGKSRLLDEFGRRAARDGAAVLQGSCHRMDETPALWPWIQVLRALQRAFPAAASAELLAGEPAAGGEACFARCDEMAQVLERVARLRTVVISIDDAEEADTASLLLTALVARTVGRQRIVLIVTYRDVPSALHRLAPTLRELLRASVVERVRVAGLDRDAVVALSEHVLARRMAEPLVAHLHQWTEGNPLLLAEVLRSLDPAALPVLERQPSAVRVPDAVGEALLGQVAALSPEGAEILRGAAVLGREFEVTTLAAIAAVAGEPLLRGLDEAIAAGLLVERDGRHRFAHGIVADVLYGATAAVERLRLHERAAAALAALPDAAARGAAIDRHRRAVLALGGDAGHGADVARQAVDGVRRDATGGPRRTRFRCDGEYWTIAFDGLEVRVRDARGIRFLAQLLWQPYQQFHAVELVASSAPGPKEWADLPAVTDACTVRLGLGDAGALLDAQARSAYRERLEQLRGELSEAEARHDLGAMDQLRREVDFLTTELLEATRGRRAADHAERARLAVTKAVKSALHRLAAVHPRLAAHLQATVRRGYFCVYTPDPRTPITWSRE
jgi:AAA ATPase domain